MRTRNKVISEETTNASAVVHIKYNSGRPDSETLVIDSRPSTHDWHASYMQDETGAAIPSKPLSHREVTWNYGNSGGVYVSFWEARTALASLYEFIPVNYIHEALRNSNRIPRHFTDLQLFYKNRFRFVNDAPAPSEVVVKNQLDTEFSIWFLLRDLLEFKKLVVELNDTLGKALTNFLRSLRKVEGKHYRQMYLKDIANLSLATDFGLLASIADMRQAVSILDHWQANLWRVLHSRDHLFTYRKRYEVDDVIETHDLEVRLPFPFVVPCQYHLLDRKYYTEFLQYWVSCPKLAEFMSTLGGRIGVFLQQWGVLDFSAIWDVIPFSFIVDWFINLGTWLHKAPLEDFDATPVVENYHLTCDRLYNLKFEMYGNSFAGPLSGPSDSIPSWVPVGTLNFEDFSRMAVRPPSVVFDNIAIGLAPASGMNRRRFRLSALLAAQRVRYR